MVVVNRLAKMPVSRTPRAFPLVVLATCLLCGTNPAFAAPNQTDNSILASQASSAAPPLQGADTVLKSVADARESARSKAAAAAAIAASKPETANPFGALREQIKRYDAERASLSPADAARDWLALVDKYFAFLDAGGPQISVPTPVGGKQQTPPKFRDVLLVLPPPPAWSEIARAVEQRPLPGFGSAPIPKGGSNSPYPRPLVAKAVRLILLRMIAHALVQSPSKQWHDFDDLKHTVDIVKARTPAGSDNVDPSSIEQISTSVSEIIGALQQTSPDPKRAVAMVTLQIDLQVATYSGGQPRGFSFGDRIGSLDLPDLVAIVGEKEAAPLIRKAVRQKLLVHVPKGEATRRLACRIATAEIKNLKTPQWNLVSGIDRDSVELMQSMRTRFSPVEPAKNEDQDYQARESRLTAIGYYLYGLCAQGKIDEAVKLAQTLPSSNGGITGEPLTIARNAGLYGASYQFLSRLAAAKSSFDSYDVLLELAAHIGKSEDALQLIRGVSVRADTSPVQKEHAQSAMVGALLAADKTTEAVDLLRARIRKQREATTTLSGDPSRLDTVQTALMSDCERLVSLGVLLHQDDWISEGADGAAAILRSREVPSPASGANNGGYVGSDWPYSTTVEICNWLQKADRFARAEQLLLSGLRGSAARAAVEEENRKRQQNGIDFGRYQMRGTETPGSAYLSALVMLYSHAGRSSDVVALLNGAPEWGQGDLFDVATSCDNPSWLGTAAAEALLAAGRREEARRIVLAFLQRDSGSDPLYGLLLKIDGPEAILPTLDSMAQADRFEERPLIWKAEALLQLKRLSEAESAARAAIAIDPSDGEEPHGDRMRAYDVLSRIRSAQGDAADAALFAGVVTAIRTAERADDLYQAGLLSRGIVLYQEALTHFADAYCIQSRLAVDLAAAGKMEEAAAHYRRAYELMPGSFGRLESHCFGCEGAFRGETPQKIAEQVFTSLVAKDPKKPQAHYLLGYLREEENRPAEALVSFRRAAALDPDYINAWRHINDLKSDEMGPDPDRDVAALNLLRLDPTQRHIPVELSSVADLKGLYMLVARLQQQNRLTGDDGLASSRRRYGGPIAAHPVIYPLAAAKAAEDQARADLIAAVRKQGIPNPEQYIAEMNGDGDANYGEYGSPIVSPTGAIARNAVLSQAASLFDFTALQPSAENLVDNIAH